jgi:hypothetical protein
MTRRLLAAGLACAVCLGGAIAASQRSAAAMSGAAQKWLSSLSEEQRGRATFAFDSEERLAGISCRTSCTAQGHPVQGDERGRSARWPRAAQDRLSARGYLTATEIIALENVLQVVEGPQRRFPRESEAYQFTIFGTPGDKKAWGWRFEGHTSRCASTSSTARRRRARRRPGIRTPPKCEKDRRKASASSPLKRTRPRAARGAEPGTASGGDSAARSAERDVTTNLPKADPQSPIGCAGVGDDGRRSVKS